jgi:DNA-binding transcriptional LysR family regulator
MIPSPNDLVYFLEVANLLNLSRAAETLGISQPSLTLAMQRLETCVGTSLLIRQKRGVILTRAGKQLQAHARQLVTHWDTLKSAALASVLEVQGYFTIGCHPSVAQYCLPRCLPQLMAAYPKLEIKLQHDVSRKITEKIISFVIDVGIIINPVKHPDLIIKKLINDKVTLWESSDKTLNRDVLICDPDLLQTQFLFKKMKKHGFVFSRIIPTNNLEVIAELTEKGCGIGIMPSNIAKLKSVRLVKKAPHFDDELCLVYHGENREVKAIQVIVDAVKNAMLTPTPTFRGQVTGRWGRA